MKHSILSAALLCAFSVSAFANDDEREALTYSAYVDQAYYSVVEEFGEKTFIQSCNEEVHDFFAESTSDQKTKLVVDCLEDAPRKWNKRHAEIEAGSPITSCAEWAYAQSAEYWDKAEIDMLYHPFASSTPGAIRFEGVLMELPDSGGQMQIVGKDAIIVADHFDEETDTIKPEKIAIGKPVRGYASRTEAVEINMESGEKRKLQAVELNCIEPKPEY